MLLPKALVIIATTLIISVNCQNPKIENIGEFKRLAHQLSSGNISILNERVFYIPNLKYDGRGPDAYFWIGNGTKGPNSQGILVPDEHGSKEILQRYNGQNIYLTLPVGQTVKSIDYLGMWCVQYSHNFGYVDIPKDLEVFPAPSNFNLIPMKGFSGKNLSSGPAALIDRQTIFVPDFTSNEDMKSLEFCANGPKGLEKVVNREYDNNIILNLGFEYLNGTAYEFGVCARKNGKLEFVEKVSMEPHWETTREVKNPPRTETKVPTTEGGGNKDANNNSKGLLPEIISLIFAYLILILV